MSAPEPIDDAHSASAEETSLESVTALRYRMLFDTIAQGMVWHDDEGRVLSANPAAERIMGITLEQMQNRPVVINRNIHPLRDDGSEYAFEDRPTVRAIQTGQPVIGATLGFHHPILGELRWLRVDAIPEVDPKTGAAFVFTIFEDITERRRAQKEAEEATRRVVTILENVTDAFFALDHDFRYSYVNRRGEEITRRSREELLGQCVWDVYPDLVGTEFHKQYLRVMNGGEPITFEEFYPGSQTWYRAHAYGTPDGIAVYLRNITSDRQAEEERRLADRRQREFMRDVLKSVTGGKLLLCLEASDLPGPCPECDSVTLTQQEGLRPLRQLAEQAARSEGFSDERRHDLVTAASEAGMNAIVHAGGGEACVRILPDGVIQIWIIDEGPGIAFENLPRATLQEGFTTAGTLGHGMKMMLRAVDRIYLRTTPAGATVVLEQGPTPTPNLLLSEW